MIEWIVLFLLVSVLSYLYIRGRSFDTPFLTGRLLVFLIYEIFERVDSKLSGVIDTRRLKRKLDHVNPFPLLKIRRRPRIDLGSLRKNEKEEVEKGVIK